MKGIIVVGLGFGDEGKGATVDYLVRRYNTPLVVKYSGGCQSQHNVTLPSGEVFCFSQYGAGTLAGAATFLAQEFIFDPPALARECLALHALTLIAPTITVDPRCLVTTKYHRAVNIISEEVHKHGSTGRGIGACRSFSIAYPENSLRVADLCSRATVEGKLRFYISKFLRHKYYDDAAITAEVQTLCHPMTRSLFNVCRWEDYPKPDHAVFEGGQGVLLDEKYGFHPHTTWSNVMPIVAMKMCDIASVVGVTRSYLTRHGAGPFPVCYTINMKDKNNPPHEHAGSMRFGYLNKTLLEYSLKCCEVSGCHVDVLAVNCLDSLNTYGLTTLEDRESILAHADANMQQRSGLTQMLSNNPGWHTGHLIRREFLAELGVLKPVSIISTGPTHRDRSTLC